jgi:hypothetical protein
VHRLSTARRHVAALAAAGLVALAVASCGGPPPLTDTRDSARALAEAVLDGLARRDRAALEALALDEAEFRDHVWPALPAARPERNLPFSYVWGDLRQKSQASLGEVLRRHGGRRYTLVDVRFDGGSTPYAGFVVHADPVLAVRGPGGAEEIRVSGSLLEKDGRWKVFSYVIDD